MIAANPVEDMKLKPSNDANRYEVTAGDLPVHCPIEGTTSWNSHPRVYIPVKENGGKAKCPYCGAEYVLK